MHCSSSVKLSRSKEVGSKATLHSTAQFELFTQLPLWTLFRWLISNLFLQIISPSLWMFWFSNLVASAVTIELTWLEQLCVQLIQLFWSVDSLQSMSCSWSQSTTTSLFPELEYVVERWPLIWLLMAVAAVVLMTESVWSNVDWLTLIKAKVDGSTNCISSFNKEFQQISPESELSKQLPIGWVSVFIVCDGSIALLASIAYNSSELVGFVVKQRSSFKVDVLYAWRPLSSCITYSEAVVVLCLEGRWFGALEWAFACIGRSCVCNCPDIDIVLPEMGWYPLHRESMLLTAFASSRSLWGYRIKTFE